jgi:opacity protein-like surface antigen
MNRIFFGIISYFLLLAITPIMGENNNLEIRCAAFFPSTERMTDIYGNVGPDFAIEYTRTNICCSCIDVWADLSWFHKHGHVKQCNGSSKIDLINLGLGVKFSYCVCNGFCLYAGIGPTIGGMWLENKWKCCRNCNKEKESDSKFAVGGVVKTGITYHFTCGLFLDLFADYNFVAVRFHRYVNIGGFKTGLGIGYTF